MIVPGFSLQGLIIFIVSQSSRGLEPESMSLYSRGTFEISRIAASKSSHKILLKPLFGNFAGERTELLHTRVPLTWPGGARLAAVPVPTAVPTAGFSGPSTPQNQ